MPKTAIVIPCYNEERRLPVEETLTLLARPALHLVLVDDGSRDGTAALLESIAARDPERISVRSLGHNSGKGEAVRRGLLDAIGGGADIVGYVDADMATPVPEVHRLLDILEERGARAVLGSRVARLGARIERKMGRHYLGRVFATVASLALGLRVYDTQCGAKLFRVTPQLERALARPFSSRWAFDVELISRLLPVAGEDDIVEVPLRAWRDPGGSKLSVRGMGRAAADLAGIAVALKRRDRGG